MGLKEVGIHDNFFELGDTLATQVMSRVHKAFEMEIRLRFLFEAPTPAGLAIRIAQRHVEVADHEELDRLLAKLEGSEVSGNEEIGAKRISDLSRRIVNLSPEKRALFERHLLKRNDFPAKSGNFTERDVRSLRTFL